MINSIKRDSFAFLPAGVTSSVWSQESIEWLRNTVAGKKLRAFPTRVEASKLVIVDLFVPPPKNPKQKKPVSSSTGKGLPGLQYSIAEMMVHGGMAQRIIPTVVGSDKSRSTSSSPVSVGSNGSLTRSVSIESSIQGETRASNYEAVKARDEGAGTDRSTSSQDTVVDRPVQVLEKGTESSTKVNEQSLQGRRNCKDDVFKEERSRDKEVESTNSQRTVAAENCENSLQQQHQQVIPNGR